MKRYEHPNAKRWLTGPTIEQVDKVVSATGASEPRFEAFNGMAIGTIAKMRCGHRSMPLKHWHLFLDKDKALNVPKSIPNTKSQKQRITQSFKQDSRLSGII